MRPPQSRVPALKPRDSNLRSVVPPRAISNRHTAEEEEEDPFSDGDDEVCGVDFITLEPITGAECRRLREEENLLKSHAAAVAAATATKEQETASAEAEATKKQGPSSTGNDGYDFFGRTRIPLNKNSDKTTTTTRSSNKALGQSAPVLPLRSPLAVKESTATAQMNEHMNSNGTPAVLSNGSGTGIRPSYRASPLYEEFQRQRDTSTAAKILFLDEGGEFRAALGAALLRHMLSRLRTSLDVTVECASLGPIDGRKLPSRDLQRTAAAMGISLNPAAASRQFEEVADAVRYDLILVMDRFDYQEAIREVSMLDAINPGGNYSGRVRVLGPFGMAARRASPSQIVQDISDPLYDMHTDSAAEQAALQAAAQELAFACRGLATFLLDLQARCGEDVSLREAVAQSLRCPLLAGELPSHRDRNSAASRIAQDDFFTVRAVNGQRKVVRRPSKPRGYWKDVENIENELKIWMKTRNLDRLPTQKELRATGASSLATAVDAHGGLAGFSSRLGVAMASRRPNGYWSDFENIGRALKAYLKPVQKYPEENGTRTKSSSIRSNGIHGDNGLLENDVEVLGEENKSDDDEIGSGNGSEKLLFWMPSAQDLAAAGRGDLLRAIREHGGIVAVAKKLGVKVRRGSGWDEAKILNELRSFAATAASSRGGKERSVSASKTVPGTSLPTKEQLLAANRGDIVAAVHKLGGFQYFRELDQRTRSIRRPSEDPGGSINNGLINHNNGSTSATETTSSSISSFSIRSSSAATAAARRSSSSSSSSSSLLSSSGVLVLHGRKLPLIEEVADQLEHWMSTSNQFSLKHRIPTRSELVSAGRSDLWSAVQRCGGGRRLAEYMGLEWIETRGRRKKGDSDEEGSGRSSGSDSGGEDPRGEIHMLDAYEEFVFI